MEYFYIKIFFFCIFALRILRPSAAASDNGNFEELESMNVIIQRLNKLERSVFDLGRECNCNNQKFLEALDALIKNALHAGSTCTQQAKKICELPGLSEINVLGKPITVLCETERWITVLQRFDGSVNFHHKNWTAFKHGFGDIGSSTEFFLGLQHLYDMTSNEKYELRFDLEDFNGWKRTAKYSEFSIGNEATAFKLGSLGTYSGDAGDSFSYHEGQGFTTKDRDNDAKAIGSCGEEYNSAGWFKSCMKANLLGRYFRGGDSLFKQGMYWEKFGGPKLKAVKMSIRVKCY